MISRLSKVKTPTMPRRCARVWLLLAAFLFAMSAVGCRSSPEGPLIDLSDQSAPDLTADTQSRNAETLVFAVAAVNSPLSTFSLYEDMTEFLAERLGMTGSFVGSRTYAEINSLVRSGGATLALVCNGAYVYGHDEFGMEPIAIPVVEGQTTYHSYLIVGTGSAASTWEDLRGRTFAFTDPLSNSGRLVPLYELWKMGETPDSFFQRYIFTYSHDSSIRAVARGLVDAAAVDSLVYDYLVSRDEEVASATRVIWRSPPYTINPIVVGPSTSPTLKAALKQALFSMDDYPDGRELLQRLGFERFVPVEDRAYDSVRAMIEAMGVQVMP
jgi:phosphonate transport system substrate-binding protein